MVNFLSNNQIREIAKEFGTPIYAYSHKILKEQAENASYARR